jgi:hypothetical protein
MWNKVHFSVKDEAKEFESINDRYGNAIQSELWVYMLPTNMGGDHGGTGGTCPPPPNDLSQLD